MNFRNTSLFAALALSLSAFAAHGAERSTVHAGHVVDVETGKVLADQAIGVEDGRIVSISAWNASTASGRVIDWSAYTVVPGLMDMHTHIADEGPYADPATPLKSNPGRDALIGAKNARATLQAGFTTVRDVGVFRGLSDVILRDAINAGLVPGPRMYVAGAYITIMAVAARSPACPPGPWSRPGSASAFPTTKPKSAST